MEKANSSKKAKTPKSKKINTKPYLTKRILESAVNKAFKEAAARTMALTGSNVIAKDGWVIEIFADGREPRKIKELEKVIRPKIIVLD